MDAMTPANSLKSKLIRTLPLAHHCLDAIMDHVVTQDADEKIPPFCVLGFGINADGFTYHIKVLTKHEDEDLSHLKK